jgi:hypothetical protein
VQAVRERCGLLNILLLVYHLPGHHCTPSRLLWLLRDVSTALLSAPVSVAAPGAPGDAQNAVDLVGRPSVRPSVRLSVCLHVHRLCLRLPMYICWWTAGNSATIRFKSISFCIDPLVKFYRGLMRAIIETNRIHFVLCGM